MGEDIRRFARQIAGNFGTEFVCRFESCGHATFRRIHEMIGHLCTPDADGGHESVMLRLHNRPRGAQPATSYTLGESIEQIEEDSDNSVGMAEGDHPDNSVGMPDGDDPSWSSTQGKRKAIAMELEGSKEEGSKRSHSSKKVVEEPKPKLAEPIESLVSSDPMDISGGDNSPHKNCKASYAEKGEAVTLEMEPTPNVSAAKKWLAKWVFPTKEKSPSADCCVLRRRRTEGFVTSFTRRDLMNFHPQMAPLELRNFEEKSW